MSDEIMVIEGLDTNRRLRRRKMRGLLGDAGAMLGKAKTRLFNANTWIDAVKAAAAGGAGIIAAQQAVDRLPWISAQRPEVKAGAMGVIGVLGSAALAAAGFEKVAAGFMGGVGGYAAAKVANTFLPAEYRANLGGLGAISREEQMFLNDIPGEDDLSEVSVEMAEVGVEDADMLPHSTVHGFDSLAMQLARIS